LNRVVAFRFVGRHVHGIHLVWWGRHGRRGWLPRRFFWGCLSGSCLFRSLLGSRLFHCRFFRRGLLGGSLSSCLLSAFLYGHFCSFFHGLLLRHSILLIRFAYPRKGHTIL